MITSKPIPEYATPRKCAECLAPATYRRYTSDINGAVNKSSGTPVCDKHKEQA
jgi:hypothetical protein